MSKFWICTILIFVCAGSSRSFAAPGALDLTFNGSGSTNVAMGAGNTFGRALAVQPDTKVLLGGYTHNGTNFDFAVARFLADGSRDTAFGQGGEVITSVSGGDDYGLCIAVQSDGKFLLAGYSENAGIREMSIVRYQIDGALDESFGTGGKQLIQAGQSRSSAWSLVITHDGKILLAGWTDEGGRDVFASIRLNTNGTLDSSFGNSGKITTAVGSVSSSGRGIAIQNDGKVIIGGFATIEGSIDFAVARYDSNGLLDTTFADSGIALIPVGNSSTDYAYSALIQSDSKIVIAGSSSINGTADFAMVRLDQNGYLDQGFGVGGKVTADFQTDNDFALKVTAQLDGKLILIGSARVQGAANIAVARFHTDGTPDLGFGNGGKVVTPVSATSNASWDVAVTPNGRISVSGWSQIDSRFQMTLVRYVGTKPIEDWRYRYFRTILPQGITTNDSDPDKDGIPNLVEYAFGTPPDKPGGVELPLIQTDSEAYMVEFTPPEGVSGIHYDLEWSPSLAVSSWVLLTNDAVAPNYRFRLPRNSIPAAFFRHRITELP